MKPWRIRMPARVAAVLERHLPFADAASPDLPLGRLFRLSLFQAVIGVTLALLVGTLNRVMIVELGVPAWWVALSVSLPLVFAPLRALIGYRSDTHPSPLGLRRIPYMWMGSLLMFGGLAIMPFALLLLSDPPPGMLWGGRIGAALAVKRGGQDREHPGQGRRSSVGHVSRFMVRENAGARGPTSRGSWARPGPRAPRR